MTQTLPDSIRRVRLGICNPCAESPYGFQRVFGPLTAMSREDPRFEIWPAPVVNKGEGDLFVNMFLLQIDALLINNPHSQAELLLMALAKRIGLNVWADYGDDLLNVRPCNPAYAGYSDPTELRKWVERCIQCATVTTVATETIRRTFPCPERVRVLGQECILPASTVHRRKRVSWRGMSSHEEDIDSVLDQLANVVGDPLFAEWQWVLFGDPRWNLWERLARAAGEDPVKVNMGESQRIILTPFFETVHHFYDAWGAFAPFLHIVPLADNAFNRAKNPNAWLEASALGAAVIVPDYLPEWDVPGVIRYAGGALHHNGKEDFATVLRREMAEWQTVATRVPEKLPGETGEPKLIELGRQHPMVAVARAEIYPAHTMPVNNRKRWAIIRKLMGVPARADAAIAGEPGKPFVPELVESEASK